VELSNIGSDGVERRLRNSATMFGVTLTGVVALRLIHAPPWAYALLVFPFWLSSFLVFQGLFKTCTIMAKRGLRDVGDGSEKIANPAVSALMRLRGRRVWYLTWATAILATAGVIAAVAIS
jgi:hypothetical protein